MPTYEYYCDACKKEFSVVRRISESGADTVCPACKGKDVRRLISRVFAKTSKKS